jgi:hypothetical protein
MVAKPENNRAQNKSLFFKEKFMSEDLLKPYGAAKSFVEKALDDRLEKLEDPNSNTMKMMITVLEVCALLAGQGKKISRSKLNKLTVEIREQSELTAGTYNARTVTYIPAAFSILSASLAMYATQGAFKAGQNMSLLKGYEGYQTMASVANQFGSTGGQYFSGEQAHTRTLSEAKTNVLRLHQEQSKESESSQGRKIHDMADQIMRILQSHHETFSRHGG